MNIIKFFVFLAITSNPAIASDKGSTFDLYESLVKGQNYAVCAVAANLSSSKDEPLSGKYLVKFRNEKSVPKFISGDFLLSLGKTWIKRNKYQDRMAEVYNLCQKDFG